jgi:hypothetical protein
VYVVIGGTFNKTGDSIIYGDKDNTHTEDADENTATYTYAASGRGHAVYYNKGMYDGYYRDSDLGKGVNISTEDELPTSSGEEQNNWKKQ